MSYKPFKMKGRPFKRNFGIGETESPDTNTPNLFLDKIGAALQNTNWGDVAKKSLAAGMRTLKGGYEAFQPTTTKDKEEELSTDDLFDKFGAAPSMVREWLLSAYDLTVGNGEEGLKRGLRNLPLIGLYGMNRDIEHMFHTRNY